MNVGDKVKINSKLGSTNGMLVHSSHLAARRPNQEGIVCGIIQGHGGDCWFVKHGDGSVGAYCFTEFKEKS